MGGKVDRDESANLGGQASQERPQVHAGGAQTVEEDERRAVAPGPTLDEVYLALGRRHAPAGESADAQGGPREVLGWIRHQRSSKSEMRSLLSLVGASSAGRTTTAP